LAVWLLAVVFTRRADGQVFPGCATAVNARACYALADLYVATQLNAAAWTAALAAPGTLPGGGWAFSAANYCAWRGVGCVNLVTAARCVSDTEPNCVLQSLCVRYAAPLLLAAAAHARMRRVWLTSLSVDAQDAVGLAHRRVHSGVSWHRCVIPHPAVRLTATARPTRRWR
jgi:hypothetical protein